LTRPRFALAAAAALAAGACPPAAAQQIGPQSCLGTIPAIQGYPDRPDGPRLRFGIATEVQTGQFIGPPAPAKPEDAGPTLAALARLRASQTRLVVKLNRLFWSDGEAALNRYQRLADRYTASGLQVEVQLRYHPRPDQEGDIAGFANFAREAVRRFGPNPGVVGIQVTNEVNLPLSPDSSDGAFAGARDALVEGVLAAKDEARRRGYGQLEIGFAWAYRFTPDAEAGFWEHIRRAGTRFASAIDWISLDAYPGTLFPPLNTPDDGERGAMVNAMSSLRCYMGAAGIPDSVPIHVGENGFPTSPPARTYERQAEVMENMVRAVHDFRGAYNVSDYRWFNLRDADSSSPNFQQQYGILRDDYSEKPAFGVYRRLLSELARREPPTMPPALRLRLRCARGARLAAALTGPDRRQVRRVSFLAGRRLLAVDRRPPFSRRIQRRRLGRALRRLRASVLLHDGRRLILAGPVPRCAR
jgi:hypothetical protein